MKRILISFCFVVITIIFANVVCAMNSLVSPEDINKMQKAGINNSVIQMLVAEQTCSVTGELLMRLKSAGANDNMMKALILADRYKNPKKAELSPEQVEMLKKAGFSDEVIMQIINNSPVKRVIDDQGNESIVYGTHRGQESESKPSAESQGTYNINIEKVEHP